MGSSTEMDLGGLDLVVNSLKVGATAAGQAGTTLTGAEVIVLDSVTAGTAAASKAVVLDSGTKVSGIKNITYAAGTATVAPINLTTGTNLTTATAGAVEFDGNAFYGTSQASSRQVLDAEQYIIQAADSTADNNTGLDTAVAAAVFTASNGAVTLVAGKTYIFEFNYMLTNTGTTSHTWATALGGTATFNTGSSYSVTGWTGVTASTPNTGGLSGFIASTTLSTAVVVTAASTSATEQVNVSGSGIIVVNAGGTVIPQMKASARPGASGTPGVVHKAGSYFRIWQVPTLGSVGNWS